MGITIDNASITSVTIDGQQVQEITIDGTSVWSYITPDTPSNISPSDGATGVYTAPTLEASDFSVTNASDTIAAAEWKLVDTGDNSIIYQQEVSM